MKKILVVFSIVLAAAACTGKNKGWSQGDRDTLTTSCFEKAKNPALEESKLKAYCTCYQQNLEKKYPDINELKKVDGKEIAKSAEECLPMMFK